MSVFKKIVASIMLGTALATATFAVPADTFLAEQTSMTVEAASNLSTPKIQSAIYQGNGKVLLSWGRVSKASGYKICYSTDGGKNYQSISNTTTKTTMTINVTEGKTYNFSVRAYRTVNGSTEYSDWSKDAVCKTVVTKPDDVPNVFAWSLENKGALVCWNAVADCSGYELGYRKSGTSTWTWIGDYSSSACGDYITGLKNGVSYDLGVKSYVLNGNQKIYSDYIVYDTITAGDPIDCYGMMMDDAYNLAYMYGVKVVCYDVSNGEEVVVKNNFMVTTQYVQNGKLYLGGERVSYFGIFEAIDEISSSWSNIKNDWSLSKSIANDFLSFFE